MRTKIAFLLILSLFVITVSCIPKIIADSVLPQNIGYPDFADKNIVVKEAQVISDGLEKHIYAWLDGKASAEIPEGLLPKGMNLIDAPFVLVKPEDVKAADIWLVREAEYKLDFNSLRGLYADPHCTYIVPSSVILPFGHKLILEGQFPYSRFFDIQMSPPLNPEYYYFDKKFGVAEVPIVDVDITPLAGSTNPFRLNANRNALDRNYKVTFEMKIGDGIQIEPAYKEPFHRNNSNFRYASAIQYQGPMGYKDIAGGHKRGKWDDGTLWIRYYAPDKEKGSLGGVPLPKIHYETPTGEKYYILSKNKALEEAQFNARFPAKVSSFDAPKVFSTTSDFGWMRDLDIYHGLVGSIYQSVGKTSAKEKAEGRAVVKSITSKGEEGGSPASDMSSNSRVPYISYMSRGLAMQNDFVFVITGKLPQFPKTINGSSKMAGGQIRYLSFTLYAPIDLLNPAGAGIAHTSIMDEEMNVNSKGFYTLVYANETNRPNNWNSKGISWQNSGPTGNGSLVLRWMTVHKEWRDATIVPDASNISYGQSSWLSANWNQDLVGKNNQIGFLKQYQPMIHYMKKTTFEKIGNTLADRTTPYWEEK
jgi:hypothetical protein